MKKSFLLILLTITTVFLGREFFMNQKQDLQIFAEKDYLIIQSKNKYLWGYGNTKSATAQNLAENISPYFSREKISNIYDLKETQTYSDGNLKLQKTSSNIVYIKFQKQKIIFIKDEISNTDRKNLINSHFSVSSDWIILNKNIDLSFLQTPKQGILFIGEKSPSNSLNKKSREKNIPVISTIKTGGFTLKLKNSNWKLKTNK